jgi:molybdate transport system ATP-binding protein
MSIDVALKLAREGFELDVAFTGPANGITAVFGPSGAGKSTLLRLIAGLEQGTGRITVGQENWLTADTNVAAHKRAVGYVFQEASLFTHLSVVGNLEYGYRRVPPADRCIHLEQVIAALRLEDFLHRHPSTLSGGERQRVAIGRALLTSPKLLLLDEPLASLDMQHKREIMPLLESICGEFRIPAIYVSHAPDEVARLADHLVLLDKGKLTAAGPVNELLTRFDLPLAHDDDAGTIVATTVGEHDPEFDLTELRFGEGRFVVPGKRQRGETLRVRVLARDVSLALERHTDTSILNIVAATVTEIAAQSGAQSLVKLDACGSPMLARVTQRSVARLQLETGKRVYAQVKTVALLN